MKQTRRLPQILSKEEVRIVINSAKTLMQKSMFMLAYGSGLRLSEITSLRVTDIDSVNMRIFVRQGKGDRDRFAILPQATLETLRDYWIAHRPKEWLFEAPRKEGKYLDATLYEAFKSALKRSGVKQSGSIHLLRHCFATHLYEDGCSLLELKKLLGHARIDTTTWYIQLARSRFTGVISPIDTFPMTSGKLNEVNANA
jgi:site-specific recombinase XerD